MKRETGKRGREVVVEDYQRPRNRQRGESPSQSRRPYGLGSAADRRDRSPSSRVSRGVASKQDRELYIGNLPDNVSDKDLREFVMNAMKAVGSIPVTARDTIADCSITNLFAFAEFTRAEDATKALDINGITYRGQVLKIRRPNTYDGPNKEGKHWSDISSSSSLAAVVAGVVASAQTVLRRPTDATTKPYREIYMANIPPDFTEHDVRELVGGALQKMGLSSSLDENPVEEVKCNTKFAFLVLRTVEDAANLLNCTGMTHRDYRFRFERPAKFDAHVGGVSFLNWEDLVSMWNTGDLRIKTSGIPSRILRLTHLATAEQLVEPAQYLELVEDLRHQCLVAQGQLKSVTVLRPNPLSPLRDTDIGKAFLEFATVEDARLVLLSLKGRSYNGRLVDVKFFPEDRFSSAQWSFEPQRPIVTSSFGVVHKENIFNSIALARIWEAESAMLQGGH